MLHVALGRPLARLVVRAATAGQPADGRRGQVPSYSPPIPGRAPPPTWSRGPERGAGAQLAERVLHRLLGRLPDERRDLILERRSTPSHPTWSSGARRCTRRRGRRSSPPSTAVADDRQRPDRRARAGRGQRTSSAGASTSSGASPLASPTRASSTTTSSSSPPDDWSRRRASRWPRSRPGRLTRVNCYYDDLASWSRSSLRAARRDRGRAAARSPRRSPPPRPGCFVPSLR